MINLSRALSKLLSSNYTSFGSPSSKACLTKTALSRHLGPSPVPVELVAASSKSLISFVSFHSLTLIVVMKVLNSL
jgi:hypothetical protein